MISQSLRQLWREARVTSVLLAAVALVVAFAALAPLYVRMVSAAELDTRLTTLTPRQQRLELNDTAPLPADVLAPFKAELGDLVRSTHRFAYAPDRFCNMQTEDGQRAVYVPCFRQYTYPDLAAEFTVIEGRLPAPNPDRFEFALTIDAIDKGMSMSPFFPYTVGQVYNVADGVSVTKAQLVGIVNANVPEGEPHWDGQDTIFGRIILVQDNSPDELDLGFIVHPDVLAGGFNPLGERQYVARAVLDLTQLRASELAAIEGRLNTAISDIRRQHPTISVFSPVSTLIAEFQARVAEVTQPVVLLVALTMVLLLYTLVTTGALILDRSRTAWAQMAGRGGSARQLVMLHGVSMATLGVLAWLMSVPLAFGFAVALAVLGPQAGILPFPSPADIPAESFVFGGAAALLAVAALTVPGLPAAFTSFARLKSEAGRPVSRPVWARYFLDLILTALGVVFVVRARALTDLTDPFSLAGPALLLTGAALLWLRVFPLLMRGAGALFGALNRFGIRLAFWDLERDPATYGQLVMLVVATLALGTASLALTQTRSEGAWDAAHGMLATDVRLMVEPGLSDSTFDYTQVNGVADAETLIIAYAAGSQGRLQASLVGYTDHGTPDIAGLSEAAYRFGGVRLPENAERVAVEVFSESAEPPVSARVTLELINGEQLHILVPLTTADETASEQWVTYTADLDPLVVGRGPYRFAGLRFPSLQREGMSDFSADGRFDHTLFLDGLRAELADGTSVPLIEADDTLWTRPLNAADTRSSVLAATLTGEVPSPDGGESLRVLYNRNSSLSSRSPAIEYLAATDPIPVIVSTNFAREVGMNSGQRRPIEIGDTLSSEFPDHRTEWLKLRIDYVVVDIVPPPAPFLPDQSVLMTRADWLQAQLNRNRSTLAAGTGINRVRLALADREPSPELRAQLAALPGVHTVDYAYDVYAALQRAPLANAVTGMLFAGFCAAFGLIVLQAGFYTAVTLRKRAGSFAVLRSLGWGTGNILRMLAVEQAAIVLPALVIGVTVGIGLALLLTPLVNAETSVLRLPLLHVAGLLGVVSVLFVALLAWSASALRGTDISAQMRTVE